MHKYLFYIFILYMYVCVPFAFSLHRDQMRPLDPLELELTMVISHHVGSGKQTLAFVIATGALNH